MAGAVRTRLFLCPEFPRIIFGGNSSRCSRREPSKQPTLVKNRNGPDPTLAQQYREGLEQYFEPDELKPEAPPQH
jgi:hypothetical protein